MRIFLRQHIAGQLSIHLAMLARVSPRKRTLLNMDALGFTIAKDFARVVGVAILFMILCLCAGGYIGYQEGEKAQTPTIERLRKDSTKTAQIIYEAKNQTAVVQAFIQTYDQEIKALADQRRKDRENTDAFLYDVLRMPPDQAKRAVIAYYTDRQKATGSR